jgi:hypothetical protein
VLLRITVRSPVVQFEYETALIFCAPDDVEFVVHLSKPNLDRLQAHFQFADGPKNGGGSLPRSTASSASLEVSTSVIALHLTVPG